MAGRGWYNVRVRYAGEAPLNGDDRREIQYLASQQGNARGPRLATAGPGWPEAYAQPMPPAPTVRPAPTTQGWSPFAYRAGNGQRSGLGATP